MALVVFLLPPVSSRLQTAVITPSLSAVTRDDLMVFLLPQLSGHLQTAVITVNTFTVSCR